MHASEPGAALDFDVVVGTPALRPSISVPVAIWLTGAKSRAGSMRRVFASSAEVRWPMLKTANV
ncbi:MAG TPA: hypothetical protein VHQ88_11565 [Burkholderiales bacterium]|nr:hypothetical protein [Burkholderiales bacterium]